MVVTTVAKDKGKAKILGLVIANALVGLCGSIVCQEQRSFSSVMGTGQMVFGLTAVIIGATLLGKIRFIKGTTMALVGSIAYKACIQVAISIGLPANFLKLASSVLFLAVIVLGYAKKGGTENAGA